MSQLLEINHAQLADIGRKKKNNEDYVTCFIPQKADELTASGSLFILADGVGGASYGEIASKYAAETVLYEYYQATHLTPGERLVRAFLKANQDINTYAEETGKYTKMATTLVAAAIHENNLIVANVGDSRAYLIRNGKLKQITRDHSIVAEMVRNGEMTDEEANVSSIRNRLSRSIGGNSDVIVDLFPPIPLEVNDRILLCSDGLSRYASPEDLVAMAGSGNPEDAVKRLIKFANHQGGADNISSTLIEMVQKATPYKKEATGYAKPRKIEEWQKVDTVLTYKKQPLRKPFPLTAVIASGVVISLAIFFSLFLLFRNRQSGNFLKTMAQGNPPPQPAESPLPAGTAEMAPTMETQPLPTHMATAALEPEAAGEATPQASSNMKWECIYKVPSGEFAEPIFAKFNAPLGSELNYYAAADCFENEEAVVCNNRDINSNPGAILPGEWLVVFTSDRDFGEEDLQRCVTNNGRIHQIKN